MYSLISSSVPVPLSSSLVCVCVYKTDTERGDYYVFDSDDDHEDDVVRESCRGRGFYLCRKNTSIIGCFIANVSNNNSSARERKKGTGD